VEDVPYNGEPELVRPLPGVADALRRLRALRIRVGLVSNQSGIGRGLVTPRAVAAVNARVAELLGPFDVVRICPHVPDAGCRCRKPAPGMIIDALSELAVPPSRAAMIGDIGADVEAGAAAGVRSILVPNDTTRVTEVLAAPEVAADLASAVDVLLCRKPTVR
ncbi:MAG TPA: HAD-IIIA family hydrolase, partial [Pseudonocardiaceae bacterium]